ncbi:MAG TPA: metal-dependent hydrolase [Acidimicrobiales bacterium]|nr:metal-dependent hydrolase [Acidimicrobiales bacterium]
MSRARLLLAGAASTIALADGLLGVIHPPLAAAGVLDEPAHLATTLLVLAAFAWPGDRYFLAGAAVGSVAIDLDHLPQYLGIHALATPHSRPDTHSLATLALVLVAAWAIGRARGWAGWSANGRRLLVGVGVGLACHLFRDMAEPTATVGVPLFWPLTAADVRIPYLAYAGAMAAVLAVGVARTPRRRARLEGGVAPGGGKPHRGVPTPPDVTTVGEEDRRRP